MVWGNVAKWLFLVGSFLYSPPVLQNIFINRSSNSIQIGDSILNKSEENDFVSTKSFTPPIRGIYVSGWAILTKKRVDSWMNFLQENDLNTLVININNARGELFFNSSVPLADSIDVQAKTVDGYIRSLPFGYCEALRGMGFNTPSFAP